MRIAFDVSPLSHPRSGIGTYLRGSLEGLAEAPFREHFTNIAKGLADYAGSKNEDTLVSTNPASVHSQLWAVHKKICDAFGIPYLEDVDEMEAAINKLAEEGKIS